MAKFGCREQHETPTGPRWRAPIATQQFQSELPRPSPYLRPLRCSSARRTSMVRMVVGHQPGSAVGRPDLCLWIMDPFEEANGCLEFLLAKGFALDIPAYRLPEA